MANKYFMTFSAITQALLEEGKAVVRDFDTNRVAEKRLRKWASQNNASLKFDWTYGDRVAGDKRLRISFRKAGDLTSA